MSHTQPIFRRRLPRPAAVAGLLSALLVLAGKPALAANPGQEQISKDFQKTVTLGAGQSVSVEHKFGEVKLHGEGGREVKISATIRVQASSREEAESFAQKIQIEVQQSSEGVRIKTIYPEEEKRWFHLSKSSSWSVSYDIGMPSDAPLAVRNSFGSITTRNIQGAATITGGNGAVTLTDAASANITTSFGSVDARNIRGDLSIRDNNGNVEISSIGGAADITNSFGNVTFSDVRGRVNCTTNNGRVKGSSVTGASVTIRDSFGNIELDTITGALTAETSNGKVSVRDARGSVELKSSFGAIEASNIPKGIRAVTGNGGVTLTDIGGDTYAKTSFGSVLAERINGNLTAENTNGSVTARNVKGDATVHTSFAGVTLELIGGRISVDNQNGAISATAMRAASGCRDISLKTSFSAIRVRIPEGVGYNLTARTSFGRISSELPVTSTGGIGGESLSGTIGAGGCQLQLTDSNGSIEIAKAQ